MQLWTLQSRASISKRTVSAFQKTSTRVVGHIAASLDNAVNDFLLLVQVSKAYPSVGENCFQLAHRGTHQLLPCFADRWQLQMDEGGREGWGTSVTAGGVAGQGEKSCPTKCMHGSTHACALSMEWHCNVHAKATARASTAGRAAHLLWLLLGWRGCLACWFLPWCRFPTHLSFKGWVVRISRRPYMRVLLCLHPSQCGRANLPRCVQVKLLSAPQSNTLAAKAPHHCLPSCGGTCFTICANRGSIG